MTAASDTPVDRVLTALRERGRDPKQQSDGSWKARCPAHDDRNPSLSVREGPNGRALVHCHAGCETGEVLAALGLSMADLYPEKPNDQPQSDRFVAVYQYTDEAGELLYEVCRTPDKRFRQRVPDPTQRGGYQYKLGNVRRVPYRLPGLLAAIKAGEPIWVAEGEKDVDALVRAGVAATCNSGGAGKWLPGHSALFERATSVTIVADNDEPGDRHALAVYDSLTAVIGPRVRIVRAAKDKDAHDHLAAGLGLREFVQVDPAAIRQKASEAVGDPTEGADDAPDVAEADRWPALDWSSLMSGDYQPPHLLPGGLLARGEQIALVGDGKVGKSLLIFEVAWARRLACRSSATRQASQ